MERFSLFLVSAWERHFPLVGTGGIDGSGKWSAAVGWQWGTTETVKPNVVSAFTTLSLASSLLSAGVNLKYP